MVDVNVFPSGPLNGQTQANHLGFRAQSFSKAWQQLSRGFDRNILLPGSEVTCIAPALQ